MSSEWVAACTGGSCLEARQLTNDDIAIRDTEGGPTITVSRTSWDAFIAGAKAGVFDNLGDQ